MLPYMLDLQQSALAPLAISASPRLCTVLNLTNVAVKDYDISPASDNMITSLEKLEPIYSKLLAITGNVDNNEVKWAKTQKMMVVQNSGLLKKGRTTGPGGLIGKQLQANVGAHVPDRLLQSDSPESFESAKTEFPVFFLIHLKPPGPNP